MKTVANGAVRQHIGEGYEGHSLVMREIRPNDGNFLTFRNASACVVEGLVESVRSAPAFFLNALEVLRSCDWINHGRKTGCIGGDHDVFAQSALQPEPGNAKRGVLITQIDIPRIVGGFGDSPWHPPFSAIFDLPAHDQFGSFVKQTSGGRTHHQGRHQVFEHGTRPRDQSGTSAHRRQRSSQVKPMR